MPSLFTIFKDIGYKVHSLKMLSPLALSSTNFEIPTLFASWLEVKNSAIFQNSWKMKNFKHMDLKSIILHIEENRNWFNGGKLAEIASFLNKWVVREVGNEGRNLNLYSLLIWIFVLQRRAAAALFVQQWE